MRRLILLSVLALSACHAPLAPAPEPVKVEQPKLPAADIYNAGIDENIAREMVASPYGHQIFMNYWNYAVVNEAIYNAGLTITPELIDRARARLGAPPTHFSIVFSNMRDLPDPTLAAYEVDWYYATAAGAQILSDIAEKLSPGTVTATKAEVNEQIKIDFSETVSVMDFMSASKQEALKIIAELKKGTPLGDATKAFRAQQIPVSKIDTRIPEEFQTEIWITLKGAPKAFSSEPQIDKRYGIWHVIYIIQHNPARPPTPAEAAKIAADLSAKKREAWIAMQLEKLRKSSLPKIQIRDPELKKAFARWQASATTAPIK